MGNQVYHYLGRFNDIMDMKYDLVIQCRRKPDGIPAMKEFVSILSDRGKNIKKEMILRTDQFHVTLTDGRFISINRKGRAISRVNDYVVISLEEFEKLLRPEIKRYGLEWWSKLWRGEVE